MSEKKRRASRRGRKERLSTAPPPAESKFEELPNGLRAHTLKTENGTLIYMYFRKEMRAALWELFARFVLSARLGGTVSFEDLARQAGADEPFDITIDVDRSFVDEVEEGTARALGLLDEIAPRLFAHASEQLVLEVFYRALCDQRGKGSIQFRASESQLLTMLSEHAVTRLKQRVAPRRRPSRKLEWTPERCEEYLAKYEYALDVLQRAKGIYQRNRGDEWRAMVRAVFPALPDQYLERLPLKGDAEPGDMAREYAAELYGVSNTSYLKKIIGRAREARLRKAA